MANMLKRISTKTLIGKIGGDMIPAKGTKPLFRVAGIATGTVTGTTNLGDYVGFRGRFRAIVIETGEAFDAAKLFLPNMATDMLLSAVESQGENGSGVEFGFDVGIFKADTPTGYEYSVTPLVEPAENDALEVLVSNLPKLPSPKAK